MLLLDVAPLSLGIWEQGHAMFVRVWVLCRLRRSSKEVLGD